MLIISCVKNRRTKILPENRCPVALLFKGGGGLANHPLSCYPQGVFGSQENKRKAKKMRETEKERKKLVVRDKNLFVGQKVSLLQCVQMAYIASKTRKITKLHELSLLHKG